MNNSKPILQKELDDLLDTLVAGYKKICDLVPTIMEVARKHNIDNMTIRSVIITKLTKIGMSKRTITRYMPSELRLHRYPEDRKMTEFANLANQENSNKQASEEFKTVMELAVKEANDDLIKRRALCIEIREQGIKEGIAPMQSGRMIRNMNKLPFDGDPFEKIGMSEVLNEKVIDMINDIFFDEDENDRCIIRIQNENKQLKDKLATLEAQIRTD